MQRAQQAAFSRRSYVYDGNAQVLDHILVSDALANDALPDYDVVHVNSEFANQASDHDPEIVKLLLPVDEVASWPSPLMMSMVKLPERANAPMLIPGTYGGIVNLDRAGEQQHGPGE